MALTGWYYLHTNGDVIYKGAAWTSLADLRESPFVRHFWPCDPEDRETAWTVIVEAFAADARPARIHDLAAEFGCTDEDGQEYASRVNVELTRDGVGGCWQARPDKSAVMEGSGPTVYAALAALAVNLGYVSGGLSFARLVQGANELASELTAPEQRWFRGAVIYGDDRVRLYKVEARDVEHAQRIVEAHAAGLWEIDAGDDVGEWNEDDFDDVLPRTDEPCEVD